MSEQQSPESVVEDWAARLDEYHRRIGRFIAQAAAADAELTNIIARITSKADWQRVELLVLDRLPSVKLQMLKDVLPAADVLRKEELWVGGKELCTAIGAVNSYRNALAHSMIRLNIDGLRDSTSGEVDLYQTKRERRLLPERIDFDELERQEKYLAALQTILAAVSTALIWDGIILGIDEPRTPVVGLSTDRRTDLHRTLREVSALIRQPEVGERELRLIFPQTYAE